MKDILDKCLAEHPGITAYDGILGGTPHLKGQRLSVGNILSRLYAYGSIGKVVEYYAPHLTEEQVKEAIAFAQDFIEDAFLRIVEEG